ncbi:hypothetical protein ACFVZW_28830 [Streptomyces sp. NPDC059567]|uniref:hypothetical protein n=1 Tax=Streptomyces sp. NPDC059567 TaxID=3346867 RepID=UPI0036A2C3BC
MTGARRLATGLALAGALLGVTGCASSVDPIERLGRKAAERVGGGGLDGDLPDLRERVRKQAARDRAVRNDRAPGAVLVPAAERPAAPAPSVASR